MVLEYGNSLDVFEMVIFFGMRFFEELFNVGMELLVLREVNFWFESGLFDEEEEFEVCFSKVCVENKILEV